MSGKNLNVIERDLTALFDELKKIVKGKDLKGSLYMPLKIERERQAIQSLVKEIKALK